MMKNEIIYFRNVFFLIVFLCCLIVFYVFFIRYFWVFDKGNDICVGFWFRDDE